MTISRSRIFRTTYSTAICLALPLLNGNAYATWLVENDVALGLEGGNLSAGFSMKIPYTSDNSWQLMADAGNNVFSFGGRYLSHYTELNDGRVYWYAGLSIWSWGGNRIHGSETVLGLGAGLGWGYDLMNAKVELPVSINVTIGPSYAAFSNYSGVDLLSVGLGVHYRFE